LDQPSPDSLTTSNSLLSCDDPPPVKLTNEGGSSAYVLIGDHAGRRIPGRLGDLGVPPQAMDLHIAWDIGIAGLGERLSALLDAPFVSQAYSRLVIDCNRGPGAHDAAPAVSDGVAIPGNLALSAEAFAARKREIWDPYHAAISDLLDGRAGRETWIVSLHSFTPVMQRFVRPWTYGVLHRHDSALSFRMLALLQEALGEAAGDNEPYAMDEKDNTIPLHADGRGLDYLELEVRQDLIGDPEGQAQAAQFIAGLLRRAQG
jgi:predicted N-formylglutamate amidohydrolase